MADEKKGYKIIKPKFDLDPDYVCKDQKKVEEYTKTIMDSSFSKCTQDEAMKSAREIVQVEEILARMEADAKRGGTPIEDAFDSLYNHVPAHALSRFKRSLHESNQKYLDQNNKLK